MKWVPAGKKRIFVLAITLLFAFCGVATIYYISKRGDKAENDSDKPKYSNLCNSDAVGVELKAKYPYFGPDQAPEMTLLVDKILKTENYVKAENCLYVLGKYYAYIGDTGNAAIRYEELLALNKETGMWIDESIGSDPVDSITDRVKFYKKLSTQDNNEVKKGRIPNIRSLE